MNRSHEPRSDSGKTRPPVVNEQIVNAITLLGADGVSFTAQELVNYLHSNGLGWDRRTIGTSLSALVTANKLKRIGWGRYALGQSAITRPILTKEDVRRDFSDTILLAAKLLGQFDVDDLREFLALGGERRTRVSLYPRLTALVKAGRLRRGRNCLYELVPQAAPSPTNSSTRPFITPPSKEQLMAGSAVRRRANWEHPLWQEDAPA